MAARKKAPGDVVEGVSPPPFDLGQTLAEINAMRKKNKDGTVEGAEVSLGTAKSDLRGYISTGCTLLDAYIGEGKVQGGWPIGRTVELYGPPGTGKTTLLTHAMIAAQQGRGALLRWVRSQDAGGRVLWLPEPEATLAPGYAVLIDTEFKWDLPRAQRMGLDPDRLLRVEATTLEEGIATLNTVVEKLRPQLAPEVPIMVAWDSLASAPTKAELEGGNLAGGIAEKARAVRAAMRQLTGRISWLNIAVVFANHVYARINVPGSEASGGGGIKYHGSLRVKMQKPMMKSKMLQGQDQVGIVTKIAADKSSFCAPSFEVDAYITYESGVDDARTLLEFALANSARLGKPVWESGGWCYAANPQQPEGDPFRFRRTEFAKVLADAPELREQLLDSMRAHIRAR